MGSPGATDCCSDIRQRLAGRRLARSHRSDLVGPVRRVGSFILGHRFNLFAKFSLVHGRMLSSASIDRDREHKLLDMAKDPWTNLDPQPGDFDAELDQAQVEIYKGNPDAKLSILSRRASRATEMRTLLRHARPHGGKAAELVKQARPNDRGA